MKQKIIGVIKKDTVLFAAMVLAVISAFFVTPSLNYVNYIDFRVLGILLSLMRKQKIQCSFRWCLFFYAFFPAC